MEESEENMSTEDIRKVDSPSAVKKPKKRSLVERELETNMTSRVTSPVFIPDGLSTSRYGRAWRLKTGGELIESVKSPGNENTPVKLTSPVYRMHASNSSQKAETPKKALETFLDNQIDNIYQENITLSRFSEGSGSPSPAKKFPKIYTRKDLIQKKEEEETIMLIKNLFSPNNSASKSSSRLLRNSVEHSSEKYMSKQNGHVDNASVVKTLDFDGKKKKEYKDQKHVMSKNELFELEAKCPYQVGDIAWARMGTFPFWPCIITREPHSEMFAKKKLFGRIEHYIIHVTFFGDNGRRSWVVDNMLRTYLGQLEFERTKEKFTPEDKKKDPRLYAAFFISEKKQLLWNTSVEEAETLLREPKRLRVDIFNDMLWKFRASKKNQKSGKITRTNSDVSLSESLYDSLFSEDDTKVEDSERSKNRSKNKSFDVSEVVTACLDNMAAKTGITKIQRQSHMDRWLQKAKSKTPEKSQTKSLDKTQAKQTDTTKTNQLEMVPSKQAVTTRSKQYEKIQTRQSEETQAKQTEKDEVKPAAISAVVQKIKSQTMPRKVRIKLNRKISPKIKNNPSRLSSCSSEKPYRFRKRHDSHSESPLNNSNEEISMIDNSLKFITDGSKSGLGVIVKVESLDYDQDTSSVINIDDGRSDTVMKPHQESKLDKNTSLGQTNHIRSKNVETIKCNIETVLGKNTDKEPRKELPIQVSNNLPQTSKDFIREIDENRVNPDNPLTNLSRDKPKLNATSNVLLMEIDEKCENLHSSYEINVSIQSSNRESRGISQKYFTKPNEHVQIPNDLVDPNKERLEPCETQYSKNENNDNSKNLVELGEPAQGIFEPSENRKDCVTPADEDSKKNPKNNCDKLGLHENSPDCIKKSSDTSKHNIKSNVLLMEVDKVFGNSHSTFESNASNQESQVISQKSYIKANEHIQITNDLVDPNKEKFEPCETQYSNDKNNDNLKNLVKSGQPDQENFETREEYVAPVNEESEQHPNNNFDKLGLHKNSPDFIMKTKEDSKNVILSINPNDEYMNGPHMIKNLIIEVDGNSGSLVEVTTKVCDSNELSNEPNVEVDNINLDVQMNEERSSLKSETVSNKSVEDNEFILTANNCNINSDSVLKEAQNVVTIEESVTETKSDDTINNQAEGGRQENIGIPLENTETNKNNMDFLIMKNSQSNIMKTLQVTSRPKTTSTPEKSKTHDQVMSNVAMNCILSFSPDLEIEDVILDATKNFQKALIHDSNKKTENFSIEKKTSTDISTDNETIMTNNVDDKNILNESGTSESILLVNEVDFLDTDGLEKNTSLNESFQSESILEDSQLNNSADKHFDEIELTNVKIDGGTNFIPALEENPDSSTRQYIESPTFTQLLESEEFFRNVKESCNDLITTEGKTIAKVTYAVTNEVDNEPKGTGDLMKVQIAVQNIIENYIDDDTSDDEPSPEYESLDENIAEDFRKHMASIENNITDKKDEEQIVKICNEIAEKAKLSPTKYTTCVVVPKIKVKPDTNIETVKDPFVKEASSIEKQSKTIYNMVSNDLIPRLISDETNKEQDETSESNYLLIKENKKITTDIKKNIKSLILPKKVDMNVIDSEPSVFKINGDFIAKETSGISKKKYKTRWSINSASDKLASPAIRNGLSDIEQLRSSCEFEPKVMLVPLELENDKINILQGKCNEDKAIDEDKSEIKRKLRLSLRRKSPTYEGTINKTTGVTEGEVKVKKCESYKLETVVEKEKMTAKIESFDISVNKIKVHECKNKEPQNLVENEKGISPNNRKTKNNTTKITEAEVTDRKYNENTQNIAEKEKIVTRNKKRIENKTTGVTEVEVKVQEFDIEKRQSMTEKEKIVTSHHKQKKNKTTDLTKDEVKVLKSKNEKPQTIGEEEKITTIDNSLTKGKTTEIAEAQVKYQKCNGEKPHAVAEKDEIVILNKDYKKINKQNGTVDTKKIAEVVKVNGYYKHVDRKYTNTPDSIDDTDFDIDSVSINSEDSNISSARSLESTPKRNLRSRPERTLESALKNAEFLKYLELRQDYLMDEQPDLNEEEVVSYVYQTWQYEEDLKSNYKKSDDINNSNIVKNPKQETPPRKKSKKSQPKNNIENYFREKYEKCRNTFDIDSEDGSCLFNSNKGIEKQETLSKSLGDSGIENSKHKTEDVSVERKTRLKSLDSLDLTSESSNDVVLVKDKYKDMDTVSVKSEESTPKRTLRSNAGTPKSFEKQNSDLKIQPTPDKHVKKELELDMESIDSEESGVPLRQLRSKALKEELIGEREKHHTPATKNAMITEITTQEQTLSTEIKDEFGEKASCVPDNEPLLKQKKKKNDKQPLDDPEFTKYFELRRDALMDENPHLSHSEIVSYLYKTWLYEENSKSDLKKNDEIEQASLVKGLNNNDAAPPKKVRRKAKTEKPTENVNNSREKPKRRIIQPYYNENYSDVEEEIEIFEIFKTKKVPIIVAPKLEMEKGTSNSPKESEKSETEDVSPKVAPKTEEVIEIEYDEPLLAKEEIDNDITCVDAIEYYFKALTNPKPNVFKGLIREKVCEICELAGDIVKCKGCHRAFHADCVQREAERIYKESSSPSRGRKKKKGRKPKSLEGSESQSDEKSQNVSTDMTGEEILPPEICTFDAEAFESQLSAKMKELLDAADANYDSYSSDEGIDWKDTVAGKCEIVEVVLKRRRPPIDYSNFKCNDCLIHDTPVCFVCKSAVSKTNVKMRQKCHVAHCHKYYHLQCLDHWPQTQFNSGEPSRSNKKINEFFEALTCPRHVCHTCVSDDPRGCKTRFSGDKLAKCVRCPATYHSFNKCLPAGTQILTASHIICPRHLDQIPGKVPCHVNTGWCFICAQGGSLICCEYCPTSFHAECLNIKPPEGNYMCEDCETGRLPLYGEMVWVKLGYYRWWPAMILHPSEIPDNIMAVPHSLGEFVVRFFGQYDHFWVNRGRVFPYQEGDSGRVSTKTKIDAAFMLAIEHAQRAYEILKNAEPNDEESVDIASSLLPPHYVKLKCNKPCGSLCGRKVEDPSLSLTQCECNPDEPEPCGPYSQCLNRVLLTECGPTCLAGERCNNRAFEKRLYPKLVPYRTPQRGWGLKTLEEIKGGQFVIEYVGELIDEEEFRRRMQRKHEIRDENFYFLTLDKDRMIDAGPKGNLARFMNHCCEPNCETQKWTVLGDIRVGLFAIDDIPANSEVTFNYNLQCAGIEKKRCMCGAKRCSGYIGAKPKQDESHTKKSRSCKVPVTRTYKKKKPEQSPSTSKIKPKRPLGRPRKPKELTEIEKDLLIIKTATSVPSSEESSRTQSIEDKQSKRHSLDDKKSSETKSIEDKKSCISQSIEDEKSSRSQSIDDKKSSRNLSISDKKSSRSKSIDGKSTKTLKRKRVSISTDEVSISNGCEPSVKKQKCEEKSSVVGD